jgi:hypothetical protein
LFGLTTYFFILVDQRRIERENVIVCVHTHSVFYTHSLLVYLFVWLSSKLVFINLFNFFVFLSLCFYHSLGTKNLTFSLYILFVSLFQLFIMYSSFVCLIVFSFFSVYLFFNTSLSFVSVFSSVKWKARNEASSWLSYNNALISSLPNCPLAMWKEDWMGRIRSRFLLVMYTLLVRDESKNRMKKIIRLQIVLQWLVKNIL